MGEYGDAEEEPASPSAALATTASSPAPVPAPAAAPRRRMLSRGRRCQARAHDWTWLPVDDDEPPECDGLYGPLETFENACLVCGKRTRRLRLERAPPALAIAFKSWTGGYAVAGTRPRVQVRSDTSWVPLDTYDKVVLVGRDAPELSFRLQSRPGSGLTAIVVMPINDDVYVLQEAKMCRDGGPEGWTGILRSRPHDGGDSASFRIAVGLRGIRSGSGDTGVTPSLAFVVPRCAPVFWSPNVEAVTAAQRRRRAGAG